MKNLSFNKIVIIGCGFVGSATAFALMQSGLFREIVLIDSDFKKAEGEALDISHGVPFVMPTIIRAGNYNDIKNAGIVVITAGANQQLGESRLELVKNNIEIYKKIIPKIVKLEYQGLVLVVSNPVDILTYVTLKLSGFESNRVIGSGTLLDSARLKSEIGAKLHVDNRSVHAFIIGEHGDSEIVVWSSANISGVKLRDFCEMTCNLDSTETTEKIARDVRNSAYEIISMKKATNYGIAMSVKRICEAIIRNERSILPVSSCLNGEFGLKKVSLSLPTIIGKNGIETILPISLNKEELEELKTSAKTLKNILKSNGFE